MNCFAIFEFFKWLFDTAIFGTIIGFLLGRFGSSAEENRKRNEEGQQLLRNLFQEVAGNRLKSQAILDGRDPAFFDVYCWANLRFSNHFSVLSEDKHLIDTLYDLYYVVYNANLRVGGCITAIDNVIRTGVVNQKPNEILVDFINRILLPKLNKVEGELGAFLRSRKVIA